MSTDSLYSQLKAAHHPEVLAALRRQEQPVPVHVQLILSDLCNQDCGFCAYRMSTGLSNELFVGESPLAKIGHNNPQRQIPLAKAWEIIEDCATLGVKAIQFTGGGEPTAHPECHGLMALAARRGLETALVTNGLRLQPTHQGTLATKWIRVSVDAGTAEAYAQVRRVPAGHWAQVWRNIRGLREANYGGVLGVGFVVTPENYRGISAAAHLAREAGVDYLRVGAVFSKDGLRYYGDELPNIMDYIEGAKLVSGAGFKVVDLFGRRLGDLEAGQPDDPECFYQHFTMYIGGDLNIYRCCNTAYTVAGKVGSLREARLRDVLPTLAYRPFDARGCTYCQFLGQNRAIRALVTPPDHVNFV